MKHELIITLSNPEGVYNALREMMEGVWDDFIEWFNVLEDVPNHYLGSFDGLEFGHRVDYMLTWLDKNG